MNYLPFGGFEVPRKPRNNLVDMSRKSKKDFWEFVDAEGQRLSEACGCYVFAMQAGGGLKPWYVGRAEKQSFYSECFTADKQNHYNHVLAENGRGTPLLFLIARHTPQGRLCRPTKRGYDDVRFLENLLIGMAIRRNGELRNIAGTKLLREIHVHGLVNPRSAGNPGGSARNLKRALGID